MNKKEVAEIRKTLKYEGCVLSRIAGCYVNGDKQKVGEFIEPLLSLPEEELLKYLELFKKLLPWKNVVTHHYRTSDETAPGSQAALYQLRESELKDEGLLEEFYARVIENYENQGNYLILLAYGAYDVPGKADDGSMIADASEEMYRHLFCCICPVELDKPALAYSAEGRIIQNRRRDHTVKPPVAGALFPAFNDRASDIHAVLAYAKSEAEFEDGFLNDVIGVRNIVKADSQKAAFQEIADLASGGHLGFDQARAVTEALSSRAEEAGSLEWVVMDSGQMAEFFEECGLNIDDTAAFRDECSRVLNDNGCGSEIRMEKVMDPSRFEVRTSDVDIKTNAVNAGRFRVQTIAGKKCLVYELDPHEPLLVNGVAVS